MSHSCRKAESLHPASESGPHKTEVWRCLGTVASLLRLTTWGRRRRNPTERRHPAMVRNNLSGRVTLLGLGVLGLVGSVLISVPARAQADSRRDLGSVTTSESFCADLDREVALPPSAFRSLRGGQESANALTQPTTKP